MNNEFQNPNYEKLTKNPLEDDLKSFSKLILTMKPFISDKEFYKMKAKQSIKKCYGIIKWKKDRPLRPIVSSINSITIGAESYILEILKKFESQFMFSVNSSKSFKDWFIKHSPSFNDNNYEIISMDIVKLYPNIDTNLTAEFIIKKIYENPLNYFPEKKDEQGNNIFPPKSIFENFLDKILHEFTAFECLSGFFRQKKGANMGGKISPILANIYLNIFEAEIIPNWIENKKIKGFVRYVDDCFICIKKTEKINFFNQMNNLHQNLKYTVDSSKNGELVFLDMTIFFDEKYHIKHYKKPSASKVLTNFKSETPKKYKISSLMGSIYRVNDTTSNENELENGLKDLKMNFINNGYPINLVNEKVTEIKNRDFKPKERKIDWKKEIRENPDRNFTFNIDFTATRCQKIERKFRKLIKSKTPNFNISFAWKTVKLARYLTPKTKPATDKLQVAGSNYNFICFCEDTYIGESKRPLIERIKEHQRPSYNTAICKHISECPLYLEELKKKYGTIPNRNTVEFLSERFEILHKNLYFDEDRKIMEALLICFRKPTLNAQVKHKYVSLI